MKTFVVSIIYIRDYGNGSRQNILRTTVVYNVANKDEALGFALHENQENKNLPSRIDTFTVAEVKNNENESALEKERIVRCIAELVPESASGSIEHERGYQEALKKVLSIVKNENTNENIRDSKEDH